MSPDPAISVLLTAYNHEAYVEQALESVAAQTFRDFELIVTDDCSTDGSREVIASWLQRTGFDATFVANERNLGICAVRNRGLRLAKGRFVCSLAADDWYEADRLERQHAFFRNLTADVGLIYSDVRLCDATGEVMAPSMIQEWLGGRPVEGWVFDDLIRCSILPAAGVMVRRTALEAVGDYDETLYAEDYDMWLRLADRFQVRYLAGVASNYRVLPTSMSNSHARKATIADYNVRVLLKWLGRDPATDRVIAGRVCSEALVIGHSDRRDALWALGKVESIDPSATRSARASLAAPGIRRARAAVGRARRLLLSRRP